MQTRAVNPSIRRFTILLAAGWFIAAANIATATIYNPFSYTSIGTLNPGSGSSVVINTTTGTITVGSTIYTGFIDSQGNSAGADGAPSVAVFDFDNISIASSDSITVTGTNGLALLSRSTVTISPLLSLDGAVGTNGATGSASNAPGGAGGAGGYAGGNGGQPDLTGDQKFAGVGVGSTAGAGPGGGQTAGNNGLYNRDSGGGGGFGGIGGTGLGGQNVPSGSNAHGGVGGGAYGLATPLGALSTLSGGSGGGGGNFLNIQFSGNTPDGFSTGAGGGGGGGAVEIVGITGIQLNGISANGGQAGVAGGEAGGGGGGSGGDIILVGHTVSATTVSTNGGISPGDTDNGTTDAGGSGAGGRILVETASGSSPTGIFSVTGGPPPFMNNANFTNFGGGDGTLAETSTSFSAPTVINLNARRGTGSVSATLSITNTGSPGSVLFGEVRGISNLPSNLTGMPAIGTAFTLDPFTPTQTYTLTYTPNSTDRPSTGIVSLLTNAGSPNITVNTQLGGPHFSSNFGPNGGTVNFGTVDFGSSKTVNLDLQNTSNDLGGHDTSPTTQLDITGYSLLTMQNGVLVPATQSVFGLQTFSSNSPIFEGSSLTVPIIFSPSDNIPFSDVLQIDTDAGGPIGQTNSVFNFTLNGNGVNPLLGDANFDNIVNNTDLQILENGYAKQLTGWSNGDFNQDGVINADDFALFAKGVADYNAGVDSAPEPAGTLMLSLLALPVLNRRRNTRAA